MRMLCQAAERDHGVHLGLFDQRDRASLVCQHGHCYCAQFVLRSTLSFCHRLLAVASPSTVTGECMGCRDVYASEVHGKEMGPL